jgi:2-polyprenyl-3-methyl-5-hydroxy-6-metoxy-1,4-benzoquinol methylase
MVPITCEPNAETRQSADPAPSEFSWSTLYRLRKEAARRFGPLYSLPIVKRASGILLDAARSGDRILEVGAGDRRMRAKLERAHGGVHYESLDVDPQGDHDYGSLSEVTGPYDLVFAFEVVEHLPVDDIVPWLSALCQRTRRGGTLLLSTPNTYYPPAYLRDATHRTPLCYDELSALCAASGWQVERVMRVYHEPVHRTLVRRYLFGWLFRLLGLDFAKQIVLLARKP